MKYLHGNNSICLTIFLTFFISFSLHQAFASNAGEDHSAKWIWHPDVDPHATNSFVYFRKEFELDPNVDRSPNLNIEYISLDFAADANARLWVNGQLLRRKVTRYHPDFVRPENVNVGPYLREGKNVILVLHHNWGDIKNFQRQEKRRAGLYIYDNKKNEYMSTDSSWQTAIAPQFVQHEQQIIGVIGDLRIRFPIIIDGRKVVDGSTSADYEERPQLDWKQAVEIEEPIWTIREYDLDIHPQREYAFPVQRLIAAGQVDHGDDFSASLQALKNDVAFAGKMENADYKPDPQLIKASQLFPKGEAVTLKGMPGESVYLTFDFHQPVHGYPYFECQTDVKGAAVSLGYGELNVSPYDGTLHIDPETGKIRTQGVVGKHYGDRYLTAGEGVEEIEFPDERTARYITVHVTFPEEAGGECRLTLNTLGIVKSQYPVDWVGDFECGDPIIEQIEKLSKIHAEITMSDTYVDTPGREDGQWLEDIRLRAKIAEAWCNDHNLRKLTLLHAAECRVDGRFLSFAPQSFVNITGWDWGMQWIAMLYDEWQWNGIRDYHTLQRYILTDLYRALKQYVFLLLENVGDDGLFRTNNVFADIRVGEHPQTSEDVSVIVHCWLIERLQQAAELAKGMKEENTANKWLDVRQKMIEAFHRDLTIRESGLTYAADVYYNDKERAEGKSQAAQISAMLAGLFSDEQSREILDAFFPAPNGQAPEGITPWNNPTYLYRALKVLSDHGLGERAVAHLKWRMSYYLPDSPMNPTPLKLQGPLGGPLPEYFVTHQEMELPVGEVCTAQPGDPTGSHGWNAVALQWFHDSLLGVTWEMNHAGGAGGIITIAPNDYGLPYVAGHTMTPKGEVYVKWEPQNKRMELDVPDKAKVIVKMPNGLTFRPQASFAGIQFDAPLGKGWFLADYPKKTRYQIDQDGNLNLNGGGHYVISTRREYRQLHQR